MQYRINLISLVVLCLLLIVNPIREASAQLMETDPDRVRKLLVEFYFATGGDQWRENNGWLDDERPVCDWYGVVCEPGPDNEPVIQEIVLPDNNLSGAIGNGNSFDVDIFRVPAVGIDLSGNRLEGPLDRIPSRLRQVNLARNQLAGPLPAAMAGIIAGTLPPGVFDSLRELDLSHNRFQGQVPNDWSRFSLGRLNLANNELDGGIELAFAAMRDSSGNVLNLADNLFFGVLDPMVTETSLAEVRGLNLCWNSLEIEDPVLSAWLDRHHLGGANWADCLDRDRVLVDTQLSGSWFAPERSGEGVSIHLLDDDRALLYAFTFDLDGKPMWLFDVGRVYQRHVEFDTLWQTSGDFGFGLRAGSEGQRAVQNVAGKRIDRLARNRLQIERRFTDVRACQPLYDRAGSFMPCPIDFLSDRFDYTRLTRLAGTRCEWFNGFEQYSGAWYDPQRSGEGFLIEVLEDRRVVVYWFTYQPDGSGDQVWMMGLGEAVNTLIVDPPPPGPRLVASIRVPDLIQPRGGVFGPDFDPDTIDRIVWGDLQFSFFSDGSAEVAWDSLLAEFGAGRHPLIRIVGPQLAECPLD